MLEFFRNSKFTRYLMMAVLLAMAGGTALSSWAAKPPAPAEELKEYVTLAPPVAVTTGRKIEVAEVFWYRCPHCLAVLPALEDWKKRMPRQAKLVYVPAVMGPGWAPAAQLFHTLHGMRALGRLHVPVFAAYHLDHLNLDDPAVAGKWAAEYGLDPAKFSEVYRSDAIKARMAATAKRVAGMKLDGVPAIVVDGKYVTTVSMAGSPERLFEVVDQLIAKAEAARKPAGRPNH